MIDKDHVIMEHDVSTSDWLLISSSDWLLISRDFRYIKKDSPDSLHSPFALGATPSI